MHSNVKEFLINSFYRFGNSTLGKLLALRYRGEATILMYHRVLPDKQANEDRTSIAIGISLFERQLKFLANNYFCLSFDQYHEGIHRGQSKFPIIITFDDGYKDNLTKALPLLEKYQIPATVYCITRFLEGDTQMWWYELLDILQERKQLEFSWMSREWCFDVSSPELEMNCYKELLQLFLLQNIAGQIELMDIIRGPRQPTYYNEKCLTPEELIKLDSSPLITIGAHTHLHGVLKQMKIEEIRNDILKSKKILENLLGHSIDQFAYPFGSDIEVGEREYQVVNELGFKSCVTTSCFPLRSHTHSAKLPRVAIKQRTTENHLKAKIAGWNSLWRGVQI